MSSDESPPSPRDASADPDPIADAASAGVPRWVRNNLMGLGSAAVFAVYAAGYERTRAAAERFNLEAARRRPVPPVRSTGSIGGAVPRTADSANTKPAPLAAAPAPKADSAPKSRSASTPAPAEKPDVATTPSGPNAPAIASSAQTSVPVVTPAASPARDSATAPAPIPAKAAPVAAAPVAPSPTPAPQPAPTDTAKSDKEPAVRKDGTYTGWGTSRHGDIQVTLQIKGGKITFATISECLTRYSCSWIAALPPQVLSRQSAEVDFVSGATESANAFYYAVVEALNKAK